MRRLTVVALLLVATGALLISFVTAEETQTGTMSPDLKRGEYLITVGGCHDCHTPKKYTEKGPEPDMTRVMMGHPADAKIAEIPAGTLAPDKWVAMTNAHFTAWAGPWGVSFAANITPDNETGIGTWSEEMFLKAMRTGKHLGEGRDILPPMPWPNLALATEADLKAMFAYLKSIQPMHNPVPDPIPPASH